MGSDSSVRTSGRRLASGFVPTPSCDSFEGKTGMSNDTKWLVGTAVVLAGLLSAQIAGVNARVDDLRTDLTTQIGGVNVRVDDLRTDLTTQIAGVNVRVEDVRTDLTARVEDVRTDLTARVEDVRTDLTARMDRIETRLDGIDDDCATSRSRSAGSTRGFSPSSASSCPRPTSQTDSLAPGRPEAPSPSSASSCQRPTSQTDSLAPSDKYHEVVGLRPARCRESAAVDGADSWTWEAAPQEILAPIQGFGGRPGTTGRA